MATKREILAAYKRLRRAFPDQSVAVGVYYCSWAKILPCYYAYVSNTIARRGVSTDSSPEEYATPEGAVDYVIRKEEEINRSDAKE